MPELADAPAPTKDQVNPGLRALFDIETPTDYPVSTTEEDGTETTVGKTKREEPAPAPTPAPEPEPKPEPKPAEDALKLRLAPDFAAKDTTPAPPTEPPIKITDEMIAEAKTPKAQADMRKFRDSYDTLQKEVETLRSRTAAPPEDAVATKMLLETVTKERDELLSKVERANLFDSPKFQQEHLLPRQKQFDRLQGIVKDGGADPAALQRAIAMPAGKGRIAALDEIREELSSPTLQGQFDRLVEDIDAKTETINEKVRNARQTAEELKRTETVQTHEQRIAMQKQFEALLGSAITDLKDNVGLEVLHKTGKPEFQWYDDQADEIMSVAKEILLDATPEKAAIASVLAASAGPYRTMWQAERKARMAVEAENRELKGADPSLTAERKTSTVPDADAGDADKILEKLRSGGYRK
jgi:FtsZ-binding cell division protein ZapB